MTRSERIRLAEKAGFSGVDARSVHIERLVALVEAAEREACARVAEVKLLGGPMAIAKAIRARGEK